MPFTLATPVVTVYISLKFPLHFREVPALAKAVSMYLWDTESNAAAKSIKATTHLLFPLITCSYIILNSSQDVVYTASVLAEARLPVAEVVLALVHQSLQQNHGKYLIDMI